MIDTLIILLSITIAFIIDRLLKEHLYRYIVRIVLGAFIIGIFAPIVVTQYHNQRAIEALTDIDTETIMCIRDATKRESEFPSINRFRYLFFDDRVVPVLGIMYTSHQEDDQEIRVNLDLSSWAMIPVGEYEYICRR